MYFRRDVWVKNQQGQAIPGAQVFLCQQPANVWPTLREGTPSPLQLTYSDPLGQVPLPQPVLTDGFGWAAVYALPGLYTLLVYLGGKLMQQYTDQLLG